MDQCAACETDIVIHTVPTRCRCLLSPFVSLSEPAATAAADHLPVTQHQLREFAALQDERHREHDADHSQLQRTLDAKKDKRRGEIERPLLSSVLFCLCSRSPSLLFHVLYQRGPQIDQTCSERFARLVVKNTKLKLRNTARYGRQHPSVDWGVGCGYFEVEPKGGNGSPGRATTPDGSGMWDG